MERLWRPWRMAYIKGTERHDTCFLCEKAASASDADDLVLGRGERVYALLNLYPYNTGHLMVAPYRHVGELDDLDAEEEREIWEWVKRSIAAHRRTTHPQGFNVGINLGQVAGAGVPGHLHVHVVPRWGGDTNFMPVVADTKVLPELNVHTYETLKPAFDDLAGS